MRNETKSVDTSIMIKDFISPSIQNYEVDLEKYPLYEGIDVILVKGTAMSIKCLLSVIIILNGNRIMTLDMNQSDVSMEELIFDYRHNLKMEYWIKNNKKENGDTLDNVTFNTKFKNGKNISFSIFVARHIYAMYKYYKFKDRLEIRSEKICNDENTLVQLLTAAGFLNG